MKDTTLPRQHGAATLVIVMALLLVMGLLAAYANRTLLFEQRLATSYYKSAVAREMADSAVDWTVTMLNAGAINGSCQQAANGNSFRDLYLTPDAATRKLTSNSLTNLADCNRSASGTWTCRCPNPGANTPMPALSTSGNTFQPSFSVQLGLAPAPVVQRPGVLWSRVRACTSSTVVDCTASAPTAIEANNQVESLIALVSAVRTPPSAPLMVKGTLTVLTSGLGLHNADTRSAGLLLVSGEPCPTCDLLEARSDSLPGTPVNAMLSASNEWLSGTDDVFRKFLGIQFARYANHPAIRSINCPATSNCAPLLQAAFDAGIQMMWVNGPMTISSTLTLGTAAKPVVLAVNGPVTLSASPTMTGILAVAGNLTWQNGGGTPSINGMVLVGGNMSAQGAMDIYYSRPVADMLRNVVGSFVRVPSSWAG